MLYVSSVKNVGLEFRVCGKENLVGLGNGFP